MICNKCGNQFDGTMCPNCGTPIMSNPASNYGPQPGMQPGMQMGPQPDNGPTQYCQRCGTPYSGNQCPNCGNTNISIQSPLIWSVLSTLCCCLPFGIISIIYATQVNSLCAAGAYDQAQAAANNAKMWAWISFACGLVLNIFVILCQVLAGMSEMQNL